MKYVKLRNILLQARKRHKIALTISSVLVILLGLSLVIIVFGIDQKLIKTELEGKVLSVEGEILSDAEVSIQGQVSYTNDDGVFKFEDVNYGTYEILVNKNGFTRYNDRVKINRFFTKITINLRRQEFGEMIISLITQNTREKTVITKINNQQFPFETHSDSYVINTGKLLIGKYLLEVSSPDYKEMKMSFDLVPGSSAQEFYLIDSGDFVTEFKDYFDETIIQPDKVTLTQSDQTTDISDKIDQGKLELLDLDLKKPHKITVNKSGYLQRDIEFIPEQGVNSFEDTFLYKTHTVLITDKNAIYSSSLDGDNKKELYKSDRNCQLFEIKQKFYIVECGSNYLLFEFTNEEYELKREFIVAGNIFDFNTIDQQLVTLNSEATSLLRLHSSINSSVIYNHNSMITSVLVDSAGTIYFTDQDALYRYVSSEETAQEIVMGRYFLEDISNDNKSIIAISNKFSDENNIWLIDVVGNTSKRLSFLPGNYSNISFINDNEYFYLKNMTLFKTSINSNSNLKVIDEIDNYILDLRTDILVSNQKNVLFSISRTNGTLKPLVALE